MIGLSEKSFQELGVYEFGQSKQIDLGEIRPDLDTLLAADSVCLRTLSDLPQSGNL